RDLSGIIPDPGTQGPPDSTRGRQFTLGQVMKAVALIAVPLALALHGPPGLRDLLAMVALFVILAAYVYGVSRLPYRARLAIGLATSVALLILSAWVWRPPFYVWQADRAEELAQLCAILAVRTDDERLAGSFRSEVVKYRGIARALRIRAMWYGLLRSVTREDPVPINQRELILDI